MPGDMYLGGVMLAQRPDLTPEAKAFTSLAGETQVGRARADLG